MIIFNLGHISHYKKKKLIREVGDMKKLFNEEILGQSKDKGL